MDFGFALPQTGIHASPEAILQAAQTAERLGYRTLWVLERLLRPLHPRGVGGAAGRPMPESYAVAYDPIETLTYVAAGTDRIRLGTNIMVAPFHVPVLLAKRFATLDRFSGGRALAGLGLGWAEEEFETAGVPARGRGARLAEFIEAMRAAWGPDPVRFEGRHYRIPASQINPKPVQPGGPRVIIAAREPKAVERAGRIGDGLTAIPADLAEFERIVVGFRAAARTAGRDPGALPIIVRTNTTVSEDSAREPRPPLSGSQEQVVEDLRRLERLGVAEVFFDMNRFGLAVDEQFRILGRLREALRGG